MDATQVRMFPARLFDRDHPVGRHAELEVTEAGLVVATDAGRAAWPFEELRQTRGTRRGEPVHVEHTGRGETVVCNDPRLITSMRRAAPHLAAEFRPPSGLSVPALLWIVVLVVGVLAAALFVWGIPAMAVGLARQVPPSWEDQFGAVVMEQAAPTAKHIDDPRLTAPVDSIVARLAVTLASSPYRFRVVVIDRPEVNAFAAPGGHIAVHRGMLLFVRGPDELAGVLAHEMQHVLERHVTEGMFKQLGLTVMVALVGDASGLGNAAAGAARALGELSYSRDAELEADEKGLRMLVAAGGDPEAMAAVLERMGGQHPIPGTLEFLSTHPDPRARAERLRTAAAEVRAESSRPLVDPGVWTVLQTAAAEKR